MENSREKNSNGEKAGTCGFLILKRYQLMKSHTENVVSLIESVCPLPELKIVTMLIGLLP